MQKKIDYAVLFVVSVFICLAYFSLGWTGNISNLGGDSAGYLLAAKYYSPYQATSAVISEYSKQIVYPPLFPAILALTGGGEHILIAHEVVICFLLGTMFFLYQWARAERLSIASSAMLVVVFALMPATYFTSFNIWTENLYLMLSLAAVVALSQTDTPSERWWLLATLAVSAALLTRVAALPLAAAYIAYILLHRPRRPVLHVSIVLLPFAIWASISAATQTGAGAYVAHLQGKYTDNPLSVFVAQFLAETNALHSSWLYAWAGDNPSLISSIIIYAFGLVALIGWLVRLRVRKFDAIYVLAYLIVLVVWPHPEEAMRYSYILFPILILYGYLAILSFPGINISSQAYNASAIGVFAVMALAMAPTLLLNTRYYLEDITDEYRDNKHTQEWYSSDRRQAAAAAIFRTSLLNHLETLPSRVAAGECIFAIKPTIVTLYAKRTSYGPPKSTKNDDEFWKEIEKCHYVYVLPFASPSYHEAFYPLSRLSSRAKLISEKRMSDDIRSPLVGALYEISR